MVTDRFNELYTGQYASNATGQSFRSGFLALSKKKSEEETRGTKRKLLASGKVPTVDTVTKK